jgi:hypothetical protein
MRGFLLLTLITAGCGANSTCVPGQSAACVCSDGTGGAQLCKGDGSFAACQCASGASSGGSEDMGTGDNGSGGNGSGGNGSGDMATGGVVSTGQKRVFVTSSNYAGVVADTICQTVADSVSLGGTWVPWLSSSLSGFSYSAINQVKGTGPWVRLDGMVAFANHAQLATAPAVTLDVTETGQKVVGSSVWTGTLTGGVLGSDTCNGWDNDSYTGSTGNAESTSAWTASGSSYPCADTAHVYCFEQ